MRPALLFGVLLTLLAASPATARPGDRADARALARATERAREAVLSHKAQVTPAADRLDQCSATLEGAPAGDAALAAFELTFGYAFEAWLNPAREDLRRFELALDRVKLRDPVLKSGRAAWRKELRAAQKLQPPPEDICARVDAWAQAGYPADQAPKLQDPGLDELFGQSDDLEKRIARAGKRMRKLGVKPSVAKLWGGIGFLISG